VTAAASGRVTPYYEDDWVTLYHGEYRDVLGLLPPVDLIIADPPYGETSLEWDVWPDGWPGELAGVARSMWCFGSMRMFLTRGREFSDWKFSQDVVWMKQRPTTVATDRFARMHEYVLHWYQGPWSDVQHETPKIPHIGKRVATTTRGSVSRNIRGDLGASAWEDDGARWQPSILEARTHRAVAINETEKPTGLLEPLISYACPLGGTIFDPFAGSCSTGVAARVLGRKAVLVEKRESQCEKAALRLSAMPLPFEVTA